MRDYNNYNNFIQEHFLSDLEQVFCEFNVNDEQNDVIKRGTLGIPNLCNKHAPIKQYRLNIKQNKLKSTKENSPCP